ncbi:sensor histidine kinase [Desulfonatronum parangueonense]
MAIPRENTHDWLKRNLFFILCGTIAVPILLFQLAFAWVGYRHLADTIRGHVELGLVSKALHYQRKVDSFLLSVERSMKNILQHHGFDELTDMSFLEGVLTELDREHDHLIEDLGVIDGRGNHLAYVGPYDLLDKKYDDAAWFRELQTKNVVVSDVFLGHRKVPHLILAVKVEDGDDFWILRATINVFRFSNMVDTVRFGKTGEVFIVNDAGVLQTRSRSHGNLLTRLDHGGRTFMSLSGVEVLESRQARGNVLLAKARMRMETWSLVVQQDKDEALAEIVVSRNWMLAGLGAGFAVTFLVLVMTVGFLRRKLECVGTERSEVDDQLIQSQKLAAIGQLSAGIAHEINNPLAVIGEEAGWLQDILKREEMKEFKEHSEFSSSLQEIVQQAGRCREITHKLLSFARKMDSMITDVDINKIMDDVVGMRESAAALNNIQFHKEYQSELPLVYSEPSLLRQVFLNLINNAVDAIKKGGAITVKTGVCPDKYSCVVVSINDTGMGIPQENLGKIFDPFFTTKPPGKGTGLGLSICHGIIKKLGGDITVASQVGQGTTFTVKIPIEPPKNLRECEEIKDLEFISH